MDYAFNIDADQTNHDDWTVFINCRVEDNAGKLLEPIIAGTFVGIMFSLIKYESGNFWNNAIVHVFWKVKKINMDGFDDIHADCSRIGWWK